MRKLIFNIFLIFAALNLLFLVSCEDDDGNDIINTGPEIAFEVNGESDPSSVDAAVGETITLRLDVSDDDGIDSIVVRKLVDGTVDTVSSYQAGTGSFNQDVDIVIEGTDAGGDVVIEIEAFDSEGNSNTQTITVNISPIANYTAVLLYAPLADQQSKSFFSVTSGQTYSLNEIESDGDVGDTTGVGGEDPADTTDVGGEDPADTTGVGGEDPTDTTGVGTDTTDVGGDPTDTTDTDTTGTGGGDPTDTTDTQDPADTLNNGGTTSVASSLIDFGYYYGSSNNASLASPSKIQQIGNIYDLSGWTTLNNTQFRKTVITESEFLENTDSAAFITGAFEAATSGGDDAEITGLQVGDVIAFKLDDARGGHSGILRVSALTPGAGEDNFIELEVFVVLSGDEEENSGQ